MAVVNGTSVNGAVTTADEASGGAMKNPENSTPTDAPPFSVTWYVWPPKVSVPFLTSEPLQNARRLTLVPSVHTGTLVHSPGMNTPELVLTAAVRENPC